MTVALGIDTGGTYTDAALVDQATGKVLAVAKALTTRHDLSIGIKQAITVALDTKQKSLRQEDINMVAISTTLATNAIAEGYGCHVCLLLIGYDQELMKKHGFQQDLPTDDVVYLRGGHDLQGNEVEPLDDDAAREAILSRRSNVEAFAVSGYFGTRNTTHELRVRALVEELTDIPVTCGNELTTRLNAVLRATTVTVNARLIPLLRDLINRVGETLEEFCINAPLMVVKGDGSLVRAEWASRRPVETILSGPAASVVGACHLSGQRDVWVADMGGTTTDIASLRSGQPGLNMEGARVGGRRTMVEAVDVHTVGLGGDSHVRFDREGRLLVGPRRVIPLCLLASKYPIVADKLRHQVALELRGDGLAQFVIPWRQPVNRLSLEDTALLSSMRSDPLPLGSSEMRHNWILWRRIERLERECLVQRAGFTPTDALHVLGLMKEWNANASQLGAVLLAAQAGLPVPIFCERVVEAVSYRVAKELISKILEDKENRPPHWDSEPTATALLDLALSNTRDEELGCEMKLERPLVALGAPAKAYMPRVAERLHAELIIPPHAEVANAVGAVIGSVVQHTEVLISPLDGGSQFRLHLPDGVRDFADLEDAVLYAREVMPPRVKELARQAGATQTEVKMQREDRIGKSDLSWLQEIYLDTKLIFTAVGRPSQAER